MSTHIDSNSRLHYPFDQHLALTCPTCQVLSHITPVSVPDYDTIQRLKPKDVGLVYRCDSCNSPVFLKFRVKAYTADRIELSTGYTEMQRAGEKFNFTYLPEETEILFREALTCYSNSCFNAFASMCRRTAQSVFHNLGDSGKLRIFDEFNDVKHKVDIDNATFAVLRKIIFDHDTEVAEGWPIVDSAQSGILLEVMKDMLYQAYVRWGKLQQAVMMRQYFVDQYESKKVTHIRNGA